MLLWEQETDRKISGDSNLVWRREKQREKDRKIIENQNEKDRRKGRAIVVEKEQETDRERETNVVTKILCVEWKRQEKKMLKK